MRNEIRFGVAAAAVLLLGAAAGLAQETGSGKLPADLALVPRDGTGFVVVRVADLWKKAEGLRKSAKADPLVAQVLKEIDTYLGVAPQDVERAVVLLPDAGSQGAPVVVVTLTRPYDRDRLLQTMVPGFEDRTIGGKTYQGSHTKKVGVYLANDRTFLVGSIRSVEVFFRRAVNRNGLPVLNEALASVGKHDVFIALNQAAALRDAPPALAPYAPVLGAPGLTLAVDFMPSAMKLQARIPSAKEETAVELETAARQGLDQLRQMAPQAIKGLSRAGGPQEFQEAMPKVLPFLKDVETGLRVAQVFREGKNVYVSMTVATNDAASGAAYACCTFLAPLTVARSSPPPPSAGPQNAGR